MNFAEQQAMLSELLGDPNTSTDDMFPLARRKAALNRGDIQFCKDSHCVREYATGAVATLKIAVPADWLENFCLIINDEVIDGKREIDLHQWERYEASGNTEPFYYLWEFTGTKEMRFLTNSGVNGKTYKLYYFKKQSAALDLDAAESVIPDQYREGPVYYAAYWLLNQIGKTEQADRYEGKYGGKAVEALVKTEKEYMKENRPNPDIGDAPAFGGYSQGDGGHLG